MTKPTEMTRETFTDFGVTLPSKTLQELDYIRGNIPRSRFLLRLIERALKEQREGEGKLVGAHSSVGGPEERQAVAITNPQREEGGDSSTNG